MQVERLPLELHGAFECRESVRNPWNMVDIDFLCSAAQDFAASYNR
jgi:hypothetical protein